MIVTGKAPNPTKMVSLRIPTTSMRPCALLRRARLATTANSQNISFLPAITSTSTRMHGEFLRLLFLQAHRETTAHFIALGGRPHLSARRKGALPASPGGPPCTGQKKLRVLNPILRLYRSPPARASA